MAKIIKSVTETEGWKSIMTNKKQVAQRRQQAGRSEHPTKRTNDRPNPQQRRRR